jgi:hypothetical protein
LQLKKTSQLIILSVFILIVACNENASENKKQLGRIDSTKNNEAIETITNYGNDSNQFDSICLISFEEFSIQIPNFHCENITNTPNPIQADIFWITAELGEVFEDRIIYINSDNVDDLFVEESYETSLTITDEGPHCDLTEWEHYIDNWRPLYKNHLEEYPLYNYDEKESQKFPNVSVQQIQAAAEKHCGSEWANKIKTIHSPNEYPAGVSISWYYIRISGKRKDNGLPFQKTLVINSPMGC